MDSNAWIHEITEKLRAEECDSITLIREMRDNEYPLLDDFLYEAIFIPEGVEKPPRSIIEQPDLQVYVADWGKPDDYAVVAEVDGKVIGAAWARIMDDYGHVDDETPSIAISLYEEYRGRGTGTKLLDALLELLRTRGYERASLSVQKENYAHKMYRNAGFMVVDENDEEFIMVCNLITL